MKFQIEKAKFKKLIKVQANNIGTSLSFNHILSGIRFELSGDLLVMASTDGNRLFETQVQVYESQGEGNGVYSGLMLGKIQFFKALGKFESYIDMLEIELLKDKLVIKDIGNDIVYCVPRVGAVDEAFPVYKQLFPQVTDEYNTIALNIRFLEELKKMAVNERTNVVKFSFKKDSPLSPVLIHSDTIDVVTRALIMPIEIRN